MSHPITSAYPILKSRFSAKELREKYTPTTQELNLIKRFNKPVLKLGFMLHLKLFQRLGYVMPLNKVPKQLVRFINRHLPFTVEVPYEDLLNYDSSTSRHRHLVTIRNYLEIKIFSEQDSQWLIEVAEKAAETKEVIEDIINVMLEELIRHRFELPKLSVLSQVARDARIKINSQCFGSIISGLDQESKVQIDDLLRPPGRDSYSAWQTLKREPKKPSNKEIRRYLQHVLWLQQLSGRMPAFSIPIAKLKQFTLEARALNVTEMNALPMQKRYALAVILIRSQHGKALDDVAEIFIKIIRNLHNSAQTRLQHYILEHQKRADELIGKFKDVLIAWQQTQPATERIEAIQTLIDPDAERLLTQCDEHIAYAGNNYFPFMLEGYRLKRALLFGCMEILQLHSTSNDKTTEKLMILLKALQKLRTEYLTPSQIHSIIAADIQPGWVGHKWWKLICVEQGKSGLLFHRKYLELAIFSLLKQELSSGDVYIQDSGQFDDYREQLIDDDTLQSELADYSDQVELPLSDNDEFVRQLQEWLTTTSKEVDDAFPGNVYADIQHNRLVLRKKKTNKPVEALLSVDEQISRQLDVTSIMDILTDTEKWLDLHHCFYPHSGFQSKITQAEKRFIMTLFCYGCNLGPSQTARSIKGIDRRQIAWMNLKQASEEKIETAIAQVVNAYNKLDLPGYWGTGRSASADGTKWELYEQNLMSEYHIRYGGYGGIGYYHVSDKYIALFSHFIPCGVYEGIYILDVLEGNKSDIQPDTLHGDTQAQSYPVFGLSYLLGINLMPRIRNIHDLKFFRPDKKTRYRHIDSLFNEAIDFNLIQTHLPDMLRVAISIKLGKITASTILRRLGTYSRKNKLYFAFRELGKVVRTVFLLRYINEIDLRQTIHAATNKSEEFNNFTKWLFFGGDGVIAENVRHEQRKIVKYNQLVANMVILHNTDRMTKVLKKLAEEGIQITPDILASLSPYRTSHINRFGDYTLDLQRKIAPLEFETRILPNQEMEENS
jgi:TnpA family transposase